MDYTSLLSDRTETFVSPALRQITLEVEKVGGVNLGQGVCQLPTPGYIIDQANLAAMKGINRYTNPRGLASFREALARKLERHNGISGLDPEREVLIACGATGAFESVCAVLLNPGDEVIVFEPYYPYHIQALRRYGAEIRFVELDPLNWALDVEKLKNAISAKTKFILVNTPGNPTGKLFSKEELEAIAELIDGTSIFVVTDEIYEYMTFEGAKHLSPASLPSLAGRTITMGGYSKTFSITGWRIGYLVAPAPVADVLTSFMDAVYVCAPAPLQEAVGKGLDHFDDQFYQDLSMKYEGKRNEFAGALRKVGLDPMVPAGAYYMICRFDKLAPGLSSMEFVRRMIASAGVGAVPSDDFVRNTLQAPWVRFCLAVEDSVLHDAEKRLSGLSLNPAR